MKVVGGAARAEGREDDRRGRGWPRRGAPAGRGPPDVLGQLQREVRGDVVGVDGARPLELRGGRPRRVDRGLVGVPRAQGPPRGDVRARARGARGARDLPDARRVARGQVLLGAQAADRHLDVLVPLGAGGGQRRVHRGRAGAVSAAPTQRIAVEAPQHRRLPVGALLGLDPEHLAPVARPVQRGVAVVPVEGGLVALGEVVGQAAVVDPGRRAVELRGDERGEGRARGPRPRGDQARPGAAHGDEAVGAEVEGEQDREAGAARGRAARGCARRRGARRGRRARARRRPGGARPAVGPRRPA